MRIAITALALCCGRLLATAAPDVILDQSVRLDPDQSSESVTISADRDVAQTFEVGITGTLWQIRMPLAVNQTPAAPLQLELRGVTAQGIPNETVYDAWSLSPAAFGAGLTWATFPPNVAVQAGDKFSLVLSSTGATPGNLDPYSAFSVSSTYERGKAFTRASGSGWEELQPAGHDLIFSTSVMVPEPGVISLLGLAAASLMLRRRA
jgi:hypothetical protein